MALRIRRTPTSVLVVEDQPAASLRVSTLASAIGFDHVWCARSVKQALRYCRVTPFDVAIVQLQLGDEEGEHLIGALRAWPGSVDRIVAVCLDEARLQRAKQARVAADAFLQMPLTFSSLQATVGDRVYPILTDLDTDILVIEDEK